MKQILISLEDREYRNLKKKKGKKTWKEFILKNNGGNK